MNEMELSDRQIFRLERAIRLIEDTLRSFKAYDAKVLNTWLAVAEDYCREVRDEINEN